VSPGDNRRMAASSLGARPAALSPPCVLALLGSRLDEPARHLPDEPLVVVSPFWIWMQVLIVLFVIAGIVIAAVRLI
ncbi:MAG: hypothetical protein ACR2KP_08780, partial [Egibacteraceae bacterium]